MIDFSVADYKVNPCIGCNTCFDRLHTPMRNEFKLKKIDIYRDRLTDTQLGIFCIAGVTATLITAYTLVYFRNKICGIKNKLLKAIFYYVTVIMLVLDPIYLCLLSGAFGGGDVNGILYLMPQAWAWTIFAFILLFNIWILLKKVNPTYTAAFKEK